MPSAKQQPSNIKNDVGIRPNVCKLTFGPLCIIYVPFQKLKTKIEVGLEVKKRCRLPLTSYREKILRKMGECR